MKFAFSTVGCPQWDFPTIAAKARDYGYDGVEIRGFLNEDVLTAANVFVGEVGQVREVFAQNGVAIACLSSSIAFSGNKTQDQAHARDLRRYIDTAEALGCGLVRIRPMRTRPGQTPSEGAMELAQWLAPLVDYAAERQVSILVDNTLSFRRARDLWTILETVNHPAIGASWDVLSAWSAGERPAISVPVLNSRIRMVQLRDAVVSDNRLAVCKLGEGSAPLGDLFNRLRGIGYGGWVSFEWAKAWFAQLADPEEVLPEALRLIRAWTQAQVAPKGAKEAAAKPKVPATATSPQAAGAS